MASDIANEQCSHVVVLTKGGIFGETFHGEVGACERHVRVLRRMMAETPNDRIRFNPPGFGFGAPCPVDAIKDVIILGPDEDIPESWLEEHDASLSQFHGALKNNP